MNSQGVFAFERDSLPEVTLTRFNIEAEVFTLSIAFGCGFVGRQYLRGVVVSEAFDATCCNPFTELITVDVNCPDPGTELVWTSRRNLPSDIVIDAGVCSGPYSLSLIHI